jgi:hypothetical protein
MSTLKSLELMETETGGSIEAIISALRTSKLGMRPRTRLVCGWEQDPRTGKLFCRWAPEPYRQD